jgi:hypothetical protein
MAPRETCLPCGSRAVNSAPASQRPGLLTTEKHMCVSPTVASSPAKVRTSPHDPSVGRQPLLNALRRHWPEYVMEGVELGLYMISACAFVVFLQYPTSPVHQAFPDSALRRVLIGIALGMTAIGIIYSPLGQRSGGHFNPAGRSPSFGWAKSNSGIRPFTAPHSSSVGCWGWYCRHCFSESSLLTRPCGTP